jgi:asparagine synthase (glutamine-hydrolysing)
MCRIAGIINATLSIASLQNIVTQMCELQMHGGPDDGGIYTAANEHLVLGNRRLSLLDLTQAGHQPMHYEDRYTITYNGELYNFVFLKKELQKIGIHFNTGTDTEVILAAFATWNTQSFAKLNGMFAFSLWDKVEKILYLVRDAAGIKPLYYSTYSNGLAFASEIRAFAPIPYLQQKFDSASVYQLAYGFIPEPITTLSHVSSLPKGCFLSYNFKKQSTSLQSFSFFSFSNKIKNEADAKQKIFASLNDAVQRQMVADASVGLFLSGGIDSTILANLADKKAKKKLNTLSIYFEEENYSEKKYQDIAVQKLNSNHHSILLKEADFHKHFPTILANMDMPSCDGINTWFISKFAKEEGLKAVLSGVGADELYGGYPSFNRIGKALLLQKMPKASLQVLGFEQNKKLNRLVYLNIEGIRGVYLFLRGHFTPTQIATQLGAYEKDVWNVLENFPASPVLNNITTKNKASWMEFNMYMQDQLLRDADVMSMAHGVEIRVPFLDNDVIKPAFSIDENIKYKGILPKQLLIDSFDILLPKEIWNRPKMGFSFPFAEWLRNSSYVKELQQSNNINTQKVVKDFLVGKLHWSRIMSLIVLKFGHS